MRSVARLASFLAGWIPLWLCTPTTASAAEFTQVSWLDASRGLHQEFLPSWSSSGDSIVAESRVQMGEGYLPLVLAWPVTIGEPAFVAGPAMTPAWSPDGQSIALTRTGGSAVENGLWVYGRSGGPPVRLLPTGWEAAWHPNGFVLAYAKYIGNTSLWQIDRTNGHETEVTFDPFEENAPAWSPDGAKLAFASNRTGDWEIWLHDIASGTDSRITNASGADEHPAWSPDGRWLAFSSTRSGNSEIWIEDLQGHVAPIRLTTHAAVDRDPTWSPDGSAIAFSSNRHPSGYRIWVARDLQLPDVPVSVAPTDWGTLKNRFRR